MENFGFGLQNQDGKLEKCCDPFREMAKLNGETYKFRPNVAGILQNAEGRILICERLNLAGAWQFPQGGVDKGERREEALLREMEEELCLRPGDYRVLGSKGPYRYLFSKGRRKKGYDGQEQHYFLAVLTAPKTRINVFTDHQEFRATRWIQPEEFDLAWLPEFKKEVYRAVFRDFFGIVK